MGKLQLKGSSKIVADYFEFAINTILFQRGIYPQEDFISVRKYGLSVVVSDDDEVKQYIAKIMHQLKRWVYSKKMSKLVVAIILKTLGEIHERWEFDLEVTSDGDDVETRPNSEVQRDIQAIVRQITSSVSFLPVLDDDDYTFNVLTYTAQNIPVPLDWADAEDRNVDGAAEKVDFRGFDTNLHHVGTKVVYKLRD